MWALTGHLVNSHPIQTPLPYDPEGRMPFLALNISRNRKLPALPQPMPLRNDHRRASSIPSSGTHLPRVPRLPRPLQSKGATLRTIHLLRMWLILYMSLLIFTITLLIGYYYSHFLSKKLKLKEVRESTQG